MKYLLYIKHSMSDLDIYEVKTRDIFHVIGKAHYYSTEQIVWFQFVKFTKIRREFWELNGQTIKKVPVKWLK